MKICIVDLGYVGLPLAITDFSGMRDADAVIIFIPTH
jgi:UDP-N-acetyl-D-mannosaminuronate dehydrogenase